MSIAYDLDGKVADTFTREGSRRIAAQIADYWRDRGRSVHVEVALVHIGYGHLSLRNIWCVRSDLINGLPR